LKNIVPQHFFVSKKERNLYQYNCYTIHGVATVLTVLISVIPVYF
jgi:hypothetical protein